ncbi:MAG TPA: sodium:solute symporter [Saprospiraceae bacterium]|nr:sodium:solute symporter [Saprospiraceae bacterium]HMX83914.1 sodium:solute symporter [Saprospiraceae bacterium]HMX86479.1 sodium:solute symporter [Saprospiraceae bacterium]HMZ72987.1 sodium:solute symporter [Saprospiraceae bacterium]HNA41457.1 sodium:solute symporter [Saprospiraceae bacterium]
MISWIDWSVLLGSLVFITLFGIWKTKKNSSTRAYLMGDEELNWWTIGFSIMATQASAITFLSTPGQAYEDGMRFIQFYFGLPLAMIVLSVFILPQYYKLKVFTAYEFLEQRFDVRVRTLTAVLFLLLRGLSASITLIAPAIILSALFGWSMAFTIFMLGSFVIVYTLIGGSNAVSKTQVQQMAIILLGLFMAIILIYSQLPAGIGIKETFSIAGSAGKMNIVDFKFDPKERYNIWSGLLASFFLFLSYFGTDQSQVQRYLTGKTLTESRLGLMFNGLVKIPMQFTVLLTGLMVYIFFLFQQPPLHFNEVNRQNVMKTEVANEYKNLEAKFDVVFNDRKTFITENIAKDNLSDETFSQKLKDYNKKIRELRLEAREKISQANPSAKVKDEDYIFMYYVLNYFPVGVIGLLLAMIFSAAMSSTASEINALATTFIVDIYKRNWVKDATDEHYLKMSKTVTLGWGILLMIFALWAAPLENLIQAVNILGSLFYGTILGVVVSAIFLKKVSANGVIVGAIVAETVVILGYFFSDIGYLWFNAIGCILVMFIGSAYSAIFNKK